MQLLIRRVGVSARPARSTRAAMMRTSRVGTAAAWAGATSEAGGDNKPPHPAPRVKVDVLKITGKASEADVLRVARSKGYWPLRLCYEEGLRRDQKLHGSVKFRITIGNSGDVRQVAARPGSDLDDKKVAGCVLRAAKGITFPRPLRGTAQASLEVSLWPGDEPVYASRAVTWGNELDAQALLSALRAHDGDVKTCFAAGLSRHAGLWGRLALRLRVTPAGTFTDPTEVESRFPDTDVTRCVASALEGAAAPRISRDVLIVYRFASGKTLWFAKPSPSTTAAPWHRQITICRFGGDPTQDTARPSNSPIQPRRAATPGQPRFADLRNGPCGQVEWP